MIQNTKCFSASHTYVISMYWQSVAAGLSSLEQDLPAPDSQKYLTANAKISISAVPGCMSTVSVHKGRLGCMFSFPAEYSNFHDIA